MQLLTQTYTRLSYICLYYISYPLVCVLSDIKVEVVWCIFVWGSIWSMEMQLIGIKFCTMVDIGLGCGQVFSPLGVIPSCPKIGNFACEYVKW